jgi:hypothetical protein
MNAAMRMTYDRVAILMPGKTFVLNIIKASGSVGKTHQRASIDLQQKEPIFFQ